MPAQRSLSTKNAAPSSWGSGTAGGKTPGGGDDGCAFGVEELAAADSLASFRIIKTLTRSSSVNNLALWRKRLFFRSANLSSFAMAFFWCRKSFCSSRIAAIFALSGSFSRTSCTFLLLSESGCADAFGLICPTALFLCGGVSTSSAPKGSPLLASAGPEGGPLGGVVGALARSLADMASLRAAGGLRLPRKQQELAA